MNVHLSFDVEVWCNGWDSLDARFPEAYERYVYGRSVHGEYALPKTLEILQRHGLKGVFFVEPLFSARFGHDFLVRIVEMIDRAGQDVQLHLHPEWVDEIQPALLDNVSSKRQHMIHYSLEEQKRLIEIGRQAIEAVTGRSVSAFRSGSYACNEDTYRALEANGIKVDSSLNEVAGNISGIGLPRPQHVPATIGQVRSYPISVFEDGFGRLRPAQVGACSFAELRAALLDAHALGLPDFVIVSHNFEMLKPGSSQRDVIVSRRFSALCEFLASEPEKFKVGSYSTKGEESYGSSRRPSVGLFPTTLRYAEQALRRLI